MEYSVSSLSKLARITVRTLHHYDQIGLLKPSIRMSNGRRYYGVEQFLRLNEIIYFKKLGFSLEKIKSIFASKKYDKSAVLLSRKQEILKEIERLQRFVQSIDLVTIFYAGCKMGQKEVYERLGALQNKMKEVEELSVKEFGQDTVSKAREKVAALSVEEFEEQTDQGTRLMKNMIRAIERGLPPDSMEVQALMKEYFDLLYNFTPVSRQGFLMLREAVLEQKEIYAAYHPALPNFIYEAMGIFTVSAFPYTQTT